MPTYNLMNQSVNTDNTGRVIDTGPVAPPEQTGVRDLQLQSGDPASILQFGQDQASQVAANTPEQKFGFALQGLLQTYQKLGTKPYVEQGMNAQDAQLATSNKTLTDPSLRGYAPSTIMNAASSAERPFNPTIQGAQNDAQTTGEHIRSLGDAIKNAQDYLKTVQDTQEKAVAKNKLSGGYPFYKYGNSDTVIDAATNKPITFEEYKAKGGVGNPGDKEFPDVKVVGDTGQAVKYQNVTIGSGKNAVKYRDGYDAQGKLVSRINLATGQPVSISNTSSAKPIFKTNQTNPPKKPQKLNDAINTADTIIQQGVSAKNLPGVGKDGYVSPETYNAARTAWQADGHPVTTFDTKFSKYINPADAQDYKGAKVKPPKVKTTKGRSL